MPSPLRHLDYSGKAKRQHYVAKGGGDGKFKLMPRQRAAHANKLRGELQAAQQEADRIRMSQELASYEADVGIKLEIRGLPGYPLKLEPLDAPRFGVVLDTVRVEETKLPDDTTKATTIATVFVKHGKLSYLVKRVEDYAKEARRVDKMGKQIKQDHEEFLANVESIGVAAVEAFWTSRHPLPDLDVETWWEVWVRAGASEAERGRHEEAVLAEVERYHMQRRQGKLLLPEHTIFLIKTTRRALTTAVGILNFISELRYPALTAAFFVEQTPAEQHQWASELKGRVVLPAKDAPAVCVLDTGVNRGHPLLAELLSEQDQDTVRDEWGKDDHYTNGHGTQMAGLAAFGDLTPLLDTAENIAITHHLESVKILPRFGANEPEHYGPLTQEAMSRADINSPGRRRIFALAVTATDAKDFKENGKPSAWSAALDSHASGALEDDGVKRLICVSAGNVPLSNRAEYPNLNQLTSIEDPAQSWNALTVGAFTEKDTVSDEKGEVIPEASCIAPCGGLCPTSTTSCLWTGKDSRHWPIKPDIVLEGGNQADDVTGFVSKFDSLSLLTTNSDIQRRLFTTFGDTSAATALAAGMAATIQATYPQFWPETVRALMVHSAEWTKEMKRGASMSNKGDVAHVIRRFGYGVPDVNRALACAQSRATLFCQDSLQPFEKKNAKPVCTRDMMLYRLPWPKELLQSHGQIEVRLRVTLSYFVEPNPGSRIVNTKYRYAGCNLRFQVQTPTEKLSNFVARVSAAASEDEQGAYKKPDDTTEGWIVGDELRRRGSLHCDTWVGSAAKLVGMEHLIVFPVNGWWKLRPQHKRFGKRIRYSLVVSLETLGKNIDIYAPIRAAISVPTMV